MFIMPFQVSFTRTAYTPLHGISFSASSTSRFAVGKPKGSPQLLPLYHTPLKKVGIPQEFGGQRRMAFQERLPDPRGAYLQQVQYPFGDFPDLEAKDRAKVFQ